MNQKLVQLFLTLFLALSGTANASLCIDLLNHSILNPEIRFQNIATETAQELIEVSENENVSIDPTWQTLKKYTIPREPYTRISLSLTKETLTEEPFFKMNNDFYKTTRILNDASFIEVHDIFGKAFYYEKTTSIPGQLNFKRIKNEKTAALIFKNPTQLLLKKIPEFDLSKYELSELATKMAIHQASASETLTLEPAAELINSENRNMIEGNQYLLQFLSENKKLQLSDLENLNLLLATDYRIPATDPLNLSLGVLRGTQKEWNVAGKKITIDLYAYQVHSKGSPHYLEANFVSRYTQTLLEKINAVNDKISIQNIVKYVQEFIEIHPFADGNGRTVRALLDYMLMKSKRPPLPTHRNTADLLYRSIEQLELSIYEAYESAQILQ